MIRLITLHDHAAGKNAAAGTPLHLRQKLKRALFAAVIGQVQRHIRCNHAHERDVGKIVSLGDHLRADEYLCLPFAEGGQ